MMLDWLIGDAIESYIQRLVEQAINFYLGILADINGMAAEVLDLPVVIHGIAYAQALAGSILVAKIALEAFTTYILHQNGDPESDPGGLLLRAVTAVAVVSGIPWLVRWIYKLGTTIASDISALPGSGYEDSASIMQQLFNIIFSGGASIVFAAFGIFFALAMLVIVFIQTFIRAADLAVAAVIGSFMALGLTNPESTSFSSWIKETASLCFAQAVQLFLMKLAFFSLTYFNFGTGPLMNLCLFCGFLYAAYKSPSTLKNYMYSTGIGRAAGAMASSLGSMMLMRRFLGR
jgi:hypothetical protein